MIVTLTANPSFDRTVQLAGPLDRGEVQRALLPGSSEPGGKGVNVSRALLAAGIDTLAVLPGDADDPMVVALHARGVDTATVPVGAAVRQNVTLAEPDGTTTKINEPGATLDAAARAALAALVAERAGHADWLVLAGSLPPGPGDDWYAELVASARAAAPELRIAVDTSGAPLARVVLAAAAHPVDLIKPNGEELAELIRLVDAAEGATSARAGNALAVIAPGSPDPDAPEHPDGAAIESDAELAATVASRIVARGIRAVLVTLGARGAVLVTADGAWYAAAPKIEARSTVGAGDSSLAGYLIAHLAGADPGARLAQAVAHGSAAAALPGSALPAPDDTNPGAVTVTRLHPAPIPSA